MSTITGTALGVRIERNPNLGNVHNALVTFTMPAFGSGDDGRVDCKTAIQNSLRDGKTVTLRAAMDGPEANGLYSGTNTAFYLGTMAISSQYATFQMTDSSGSRIASPNSGAQSVGPNTGDIPFTVWVSFTED